MTMLYPNPCYNQVHYKGTMVKLVLSGHSKIDKTKIFMANGSLVKVKSISAILLTSIKR